MADLTKCDGERNGIVCLKREACYRYSAPINPFWQSWFVVLPMEINGDNQACSHFWDNKGY